MYLGKWDLANHYHRVRCLIKTFIIMNEKNPVCYQERKTHQGKTKRLQQDNRQSHVRLLGTKF